MKQLCYLHVIEEKSEQSKRDESRNDVQATLAGADVLQIYKTQEFKSDC